jgi:GNAT superfamily N-acetyltransferase
MKELKISSLDFNELEPFCQAMSLLPWYRDNGLYERYLEEQSQGKRNFLVAKYNQYYVGHVSIIWESAYRHFKSQSIPEISDLLVLPSFHRKGIGASLLATCEQTVLNCNKNKIGLGVGLYQDYGPAMSLYTKMGYQLDCHGVTTHYQSIVPGSKITVDDDLLIWLTKDLLNSNVGMSL